MTHKFVDARWRPIPSCPGYGASDYGRIRNDSRGTLLIGADDRYGYRCVNIIVGGQRVKRKVHRLVCEAWHGPCPEGRECAHLDGNSANNRSVNLAWVTRSENARQRVAHGTHRGAENLVPGQPCGSANPSAKLTDELVANLRARHLSGESGRRLALEVGITSANMSKMLRGERWAHVTEGNAP